MILWCVFFFCLLMGLKQSVIAYRIPELLGGHAKERARLVGVTGLLRELEETLGAGLLPATERWDELAALHAPWGPLAHESVQELRSQGAALLPTLRRLRVMAADHLALLETAKAKSAQAMAQALTSAALVPIFGGALYVLLPGTAENSEAWIAACGVAILLALAGAVWIVSLADTARWGGLSRDHRAWILAAECAGERFIALVRAGTPPDLAWVRSCETLKLTAEGLAYEWGFSVWTDPGVPASSHPMKAVLARFGLALRRAVQVSLMEGKPCLERAESALLAMRQELRAVVEHELTLLGTRALKPLFACMAPALFGLLAFGMALSWITLTSGQYGG